MNLHKVDFLIVGQGLAGSFLAAFLQSAGASVLVLDDSHAGCASAEAAGLINPITGRRYVKSWRIDELLPFAADAYRVQEEQLGCNFFHPRTIFRAFFNAKESNDWWSRATETGFEDYFDRDANPALLFDVCKPVHSYGAVRQSAQVDVRVFLRAFAEKGQREGWMLPVRFEHEKLRLEAQGVFYEDFKAQKIIFCEGFGMVRNPFFKDLPMEGAKGEVLIVHIPDFPEDVVLKHKVFIAPLGGGRYWAGATYDWGFPDVKPTAEKRSFLEQNLTEILQVPFEVLDHRAAVRPTVKDRRPLLGFHPGYPQVALFNGLGTKGASLAPFWGHHFAEVLTGNAPLDSQVDTRRFQVPE